MAKAAFNKKTLFTSKLDLNLRKKLVKVTFGAWLCMVLKLGLALCGAETGTLRAANQKYLESFEMWCWRRMEKISWTDHVRNKEVQYYRIFPSITRALSIQTCSVNGKKQRCALYIRCALCN
jgi:hypothetical protein